MSALTDYEAQQAVLHQAIEQASKERRMLFVAQIRKGGRARIVYASPELQHHAGLIEMKQKQDKGA